MTTAALSSLGKPHDAPVAATLLRADLHYGGDLVLHTASSGSIDHLDALYLMLRDGAGRVGIGETRLNIRYLNGLDAAVVLADAQRLLAEAVDLANGGQRAADLLRTMLEWASGYLAPVRMMLDIALHDLEAKQRGLTVAAALAQRIGTTAANANANATAPRFRSNQTLFWSDDAAMLARAETYVARGYLDLKLRIGIGSFDDDLRRLDALRARFGDTIGLSADVNGQWTEAECATRLPALAARGLAYIEQPIAPGDWDALARVAGASPITVMLDESLQSPQDMQRLCDLAQSLRDGDTASVADGTPAIQHAKLAAHVKLVKLGGIAPAVAAVRQLQAAGVPLMIGQMNEGAVSTAAALHACVALAPEWAELYGADGLADDPAQGLRYEDGTVCSLSQPGLGITFDATRAHTIFPL
ncbi:mandelate racemase/muconate lactonizing enzyme family protein [Robbsia sp. KACC 23696]|uniref:mandelate racemase/muconate lactonizing enzyme family protein n=1 Tax=Robbsia sp. KACC 23696 TaxID=3149231 RepID=UPI00325C2CFB